MAEANECYNHCMRIISLSPAVTETIFALGAQRHLIGVTYFCNYPPEAKKLPKVGGFSNADIARIKSLKPDLVITQTIVQEKAKEVFAAEKIPHLHLDPRRLKDIYENILEIGRILNVGRKAMKVVKSLVVVEQQMQHVSKFPVIPSGSEGSLNLFEESSHTREIPRSKFRPRNDSPSNLNRPRVYIEEWWDPPMASGNWVPDIIELAGGTSFLPPDGKTSRRVSLEEVKKFNPDIILLAYCGFGKKSDPNRILKRAGWDRIPAVRENRIFPVDEEILNRPGPRIMRAVHDIALDIDYRIII